MTTKRKAELQRKLALAPVPKPPAGLADRIKGEIPKNVMADTAKERVRFRQAVAFNVRVAASIILLVSSVYLALHLLSRRFGPPELMSSAAKEQAAPTATAAVALPTNPPAPMSTEAKAKAQARKPIIVAESRRETLNDARAKKQAEETTDGVAVTAQAPVAAAGSAPAAAAAPMPEAPPMAKTAAFAFDVEA